MAANCSVLPAVIVGALGVTAIDCRVGAVTVNAACPVIDPLVAVIVDAPAVTAVASPPAEIAATPVLLEDHVADPVRSCVLASL
jgi:hypothetical protein